MKNTLLKIYPLLIAITLGILSTGFMNISIKAKIIIISLIIIIIPVVTIWRFKRSINPTEPLFLFYVFFTAYNGLFLLQIGLELTNSEIEIFGYPIQFNGAIYLKTTILTLISILVISIAYIVFLKNEGNQCIQKANKFMKINYNALYIAGIITFIIGLGLFFIDFERIGGFFYALTLDREVRLGLMEEIRGRLPAKPLILVGIASMAAAAFQRKNSRNWIFILLILIWTTLNLIQGDRRSILYMMLVIFAAYYLFSEKRIKIRFIHIIGTIIVYILFSLFAQIRWIIIDLLNNNITWDYAMEWISMNFSIDWILPGKNEFRGPFFTLLATISIPLDEIIYGKSYIQAITNLFPRSLLPNKSDKISDEFSQMIHQNYFDFKAGIKGWGYNPITEGINNFGPYFFFMNLLVIMLLLYMIYKMRFKGVPGVLIYLITIPQTINFNRIDFSSAFKEIVYGGLAVIFCFVMYELLSYFGSVKNYEKRYSDNTNIQPVRKN
ncbi:O-antigen polymerase [Bacillus sp. GZT]|uniref:O-antigen polymerase n=1 Tax=Bacillus sp. GZT TaxID=936600 RepID=UPI0007A0AC9E|nr:O-antigen polymerase [Bacillus sp. GZT]KYZ67497.1 hypothetical protein A3782_19765 [Bacillus sp. GZT]